VDFVIRVVTLTFDATDDEEECFEGEKKERSEAEERGAGDDNIGEKQEAVAVQLPLMQFNRDSTLHPVYPFPQFLHPQNGFPIQARPPMIALAQQPFLHRNRRQLSIGGPPKAILGGPARKLSPLPVPQATVPSAAPPKVKKLCVNLPKETIFGEVGEPQSRPSWARTPSTAFQVAHYHTPPVDTITADIYPSDEWVKHMPNTIDVFLPGKVCLITLFMSHP
jgi:hypothetical protein